MYSKVCINAVLLVILMIIISIYCLNIKTMYPKAIVEFFGEPIGRLSLYMLVYLVSFYNELLGLISLIPVVLIHLDIINLTGEI